MIKKKLFAVRLVILICISIILAGIYGIKNNNNIIKDYKTYYNAVKEAIYNYNDTLVIDVQNYDKNIYSSDVVKKVLVDNPQLLDNEMAYTLKIQSIPFITKMTFKFSYGESKETLQNKEKAVQNKVKDIISKVIKPDMKDYEKEVALHDYIVNNSKYDERIDSGNMPKESYSSYGVLINGVGVCQSYAVAMDRLLKASGIETKLALGDAYDGKNWISHAWNVVKIGGQYYNLDTTWDDPITDDGSNIIRYSYFNVTDEQIEKNHRWNKVDFPKCNSTEYSVNNLHLVEKDSKGNVIIITKNYDEFYESVKKGLSSGKASASFKILSFDNNQQNIENAIVRAYKSAGKYGEFTYLYFKDDIMNCGYVTVNFK
ncbi:transglutaminase domain-containing protein [Clostridium sp. 'White wine YQ']|uniref:transglutaminase domain-containing protein n=1 Tax=Clostridium sp. 'White wine YQ' TaxID=3027474 RepID=UPI00236508E6|nr:transglutaminase domain-containing protein [Clostridium sp. 'White wine YQ']MDD7795399.1 transglutaminase domain-containing protein [Clostridium sp. 'White wine YQ']